MKVGILTGGGDCAGLNAALSAAAKTLLLSGDNMEIVGIEDSFLGLIERRVRPLGVADLQSLINQGGTILGSSNKTSPFEYRGENRVEEVKAYCDQLGLDAIVALGGDGTMSLCYELSKHGLQFVGVPKTIDNDLAHNDQTFGFDSAVTVAVEAIDRLQTTAKSHGRTMIVETMGRYAGWIALYAGVAGGADVILLPEIPFSPQKVADQIKASQKTRSHSIIVVAEGAKTLDGEQVVDKTVSDSPDSVRLGGIGKALQAQLESVLDSEIRTTVLGHMQRGGSPTAADRILASNFGAHAGRMVLNREFGKMVRLQNGAYSHVDLKDVANEVRQVPEDDEVMQNARGCGIGFGV